MSKIHPPPFSEKIKNLAKDDTIIMSACLLGINCVYNNSNNKCEQLFPLIQKHHIIPICPEQLGGLPTPRVSQCIVSGSGEDVLMEKTKVVNRSNEDVTDNFLKGAAESLKIARLFDAKLAILKEKSPSCGVHKIYNKPSSNKNHIVKGKGVTTAIFEKKGILVYSEKDVIQEIL
ncbi:MAG: DUF523 domain-containing protein [Asgard group archaeon]|nr:DUF523 domain-containing protein [Asgard group archaeon]